MRTAAPSELISLLRSVSRAWRVSAVKLATLKIVLRR